jgi:SNF2-related domain
VFVTVVSLDAFFQRHEILESCYGRENHADAKSQLIEEFRCLVKEFTEAQLRSAKKSFSNSKSKPNSTVAVLVEQESRKELINMLIPSSGTLLVIPSVLMEHWQTQIKLHVDLCYCVGQNMQPLIFEYHKKNVPQYKQSLTVADVMHLCNTRKTHSPVVFLDKAGTQRLPSAEFLAKFKVVITTTQRFMAEWKNGSFQGDIDQAKKEGGNVNTMYTESEACPLLKVHWLRLVVDEGHSMGNSSCNSTIQFASWIQAERRWAMSGTPTKETDAQLSQILNLLKFLQHDFFESRSGGTNWWRRNIVKSWKERNAVSFFRLRSLLAFLMKRHSKTNIFELAPIFKSTFVPMSCSEVTTYNTLVAGIQSNIVVTSMKGTTSGEQDSLLHRSQAKNARLALANVRRVCVGWAHVIPKLDLNFYYLTIR